MRTFLSSAGISVALAAALVSCDSDRETGSNSGSEARPEVTRLDRPSREVPSTSRRLRLALDEARRIEDPAERNQALAEVATEALGAAPEVFNEVVVEFPPGSPERAHWIQEAVTDYMKRGSEEALAWADSLTDPEAVSFARAQIALLVVQTDPQQALALLPQSPNGGGFEPEAIPVIQQWTAAAPPDAAAWAAGLPSGAARDQGMNAVLTQWLMTDPSAAVGWISSVPNETTRESGMRTAAQQLQQQPPFLRDVTLQGLDAGIREQLERQINQLQQDAENAAEAPGE